MKLLQEEINRLKEELLNTGNQLPSSNGPVSLFVEFRFSAKRCMFINI